MKKIKSSSDFNRNVLTLLTGTTIAQAIPIVISPILTRLYTPKDFGVLALFTAITSILGSISCARYELAIMLPETEEDALNIFALGFVINSCFCFFLFILIFLFHKSFLILLNNKEISLWLYFIPLVVFIIGLFNLLTYFNNRKKNYKNLRFAIILRAILTAAIQLSLGFLKFGEAGLIIGNIFSQLIANLKLFKNSFKHKFLIYIKSETIKNIAKRYINFPKYFLFSGLINNFSFQLPILMISNFFNSQIVGLYAFAYKMISLPSTLIGDSISQVFFQRATELFKKKEYHELNKLLKSIFIKLFLLGLIPFLIIIFFGDSIFKIVFGANWTNAGKIAQILVWWLYLEFIASPFTNFFIILEKQKISLYFNIITFTTRFLSLFTGFLLFNNIYYTFIVFVFFNNILVLSKLYYLFSQIKKAQRLV